jgi:hypothetical protein
MKLSNFQLGSPVELEVIFEVAVTTQNRIDRRRYGNYKNRNHTNESGADF